MNEDVGVVATLDTYIGCSCIANDRAVFKDMNIKERNFGSILSRIREVYSSFKSEGGFTGSKNFEVPNLWQQFAKAITSRDRCNLVSFGAVELS